MHGRHYPPLRRDKAVRPYGQDVAMAQPRMAPAAEDLTAQRPAVDLREQCVLVRQIGGRELANDLLKVAIVRGEEWIAPFGFVVDAQEAMGKSGPFNQGL